MAKTAAPPTDFEEEIEEQGRPELQAPAVEKDGQPYCVKHHCRMQQTSGGKAGSPYSYCKCPVEGCEEKAKRIKTAKSVPADPLNCPRCLGLSPKPIMERDDRVSTLMYSILKCPCCGHKSSPMPRPEFVANHARSRGIPQVEDVGAR